MSVELKIKSKHLALEPAIIRKEEKKLKKQIDNYRQYHQIPSGNSLEVYKTHPDLCGLYRKRGSLEWHRKWHVRNEARATYLARAFIKGVPYKAVENKIKAFVPYSVKMSIVRMIMKYGLTRYNSDVDTSVLPYKVIKTAESKALEDVSAWLEKE